MSHPPNSDTQSGLGTARLSQAETDDLLQRVNEQIVLQTFDPRDRQILKQMVESLGDSRGMVRLGFAETLGKIGKPATPFLQEALAHHPDPVVRRAAGKTLTLIADPRSIPTLIEALLNDEDTVVQGSSIGALARMGEAAVPALLDILASPENSESIKGHAAWALSFIGAKAKEQLYGAIASDSAEVRSAVVGAIAKVAEEDSEEAALNILVNALADPAKSVRSEAAAVLGNLTYRSAIPNLIQLLEHNEGESRKAAALALMKMGDRVALDPLNAALTQETEEGIRRAMELAISLIERHSVQDG